MQFLFPHTVILKKNKKNTTSEIYPLVLTKEANMLRIFRTIKCIFYLPIFTMLLQFIPGISPSRDAYSISPFSRRKYVLYKSLFGQPDFFADKKGPETTFPKCLLYGPAKILFFSNLLHEYGNVAFARRQVCFTLFSNS